MNPPLETRVRLATNIKTLMAVHGWTQEVLSERAGVSQKTISNLLNPHGPKPILDSVEAVAEALGTDMWWIIHPSFDVSKVDRKAVDQLLLDFQEATTEGRANISRVAELEANYRVAKK